MENEINEPCVLENLKRECNIIRRIVEIAKKTKDSESIMVIAALVNTYYENLQLLKKNSKDPAIIAFAESVKEFITPKMLAELHSRASSPETTSIQIGIPYGKANA